ncbi:hypothetical protein H9P43_007975 [Blastocladiella emersonii ATCC 22665]|nr:hypothetical protein H9P43_007975 [Blastocladiella emersonii ATCC 22665]
MPSNKFIAITAVFLAAAVGTSVVVYTSQGSGAALQQAVASNTTAGALGADGRPIAATSTAPVLVKVAPAPTAWRANPKPAAGSGVSLPDGSGELVAAGSKPARGGDGDADDNVELFRQPLPSHTSVQVVARISSTVINPVVTTSNGAPATTDDSAAMPVIARPTQSPPASPIASPSPVVPAPSTPSVPAATASASSSSSADPTAPTLPTAAATATATASPVTGGDTIDSDVALIVDANRGRPSVSLFPTLPPFTLTSTTVSRPSPTGTPAPRACKFTFECPAGCCINNVCAPASTQCTPTAPRNAPPAPVFPHASCTNPPFCVAFPAALTADLAKIDAKYTNVSVPVGGNGTVVTSVVVVPVPVTVTLPGTAAAQPAAPTPRVTVTTSVVRPANGTVSASIATLTVTLPATAAPAPTAAPGKVTVTTSLLTTTTTILRSTAGPTPTSAPLCPLIRSATSCDTRKVTCGTCPSGCGACPATPPVRRTCARRGDVALVFYDAPTSYTPALLRDLAVENVTAAFFVPADKLLFAGSSAPALPGTVVTLARAGHVVGSMGVAATSPSSFRALGDARADLLAAELAIGRAVAGTPSAARAGSKAGIPAVYMAPGGAPVSGAPLAMLATHGYTVVVPSVRVAETGAAFDPAGVVGQIERALKEGGEGSAIVGVRDGTPWGMSMVRDLVKAVRGVPGARVVDLATCLGTKVYREATSQ